MSDDWYPISTTSKSIAIIAGVGAFVFGITSATGNILQKCQYCFHNHKIADDKCVNNGMNLAKSLSIAVMGITAGIISWIGNGDTERGIFSELDKAWHIPSFTLSGIITAITIICLMLLIKISRGRLQII